MKCKSYVLHEGDVLLTIRNFEQHTFVLPACQPEAELSARQLAVCLCLAFVMQVCYT